MNKQKDRLVEILENHCAVAECKAHSQDCTAEDCASCLADHILADGWMRPPCKVGDTAYFLIEDTVAGGKEEKNDVVYTPVYKGDRYLYHECSECNYQVRIQETLTPLYFGESFKYCPNCAGAVARFANLPKFVEEFNCAIFNKLDEIYNRYKDEVDYYCLVTLTREEFEEMKSKCEFAVELSKNNGIYITPAVNMVAKMFRKRSHWDIKKLKERVEKGGVQG